MHAENSVTEYEGLKRDLLAAIEIAKDCVDKHETDPNQAEGFHKAFNVFADVANEDQPGTVTKKSMRELTSYFLTYYNEGGGPDVEEFWRRVQEAGLPFERKDVLGIVLQRDRIRTRSEYDIVVDTAIPASQTGRITEEQCSRLLQLAEEYEQRASKRRR